MISAFSFQFVVSKILRKYLVEIKSFFFQKIPRLKTCYSPPGGGCRGPEFIFGLIWGPCCCMPMGPLPGPTPPRSPPPPAMGGAGLPADEGVAGTPPCWPDRFVGNEGRSSSLSYAK